MQYLIVYILFALLCLIPQNAKAEEASSSAGEIVYIVSYNADTRYSLDFISDYKSEYEALGGKSQIVIEALNCHSLASSGEWMERLRSILSQHSNPKMVVLYGPEAWAAYFSLEEEEYKRIPVCCMAAQHYGAVLPGNDLPSVSEERFPEKDVVDFFEVMKGFNVKMCYYYEYDVVTGCEITKKILPSIENMCVISDNSYAGLSQSRLIKHFAAEKSLPYTFTYIDGSQLNMEQAKGKLVHIPYHSAILFCTWRYDSKSVIYLTNNEPVFKQYTKGLPVLSLTSSGFGNWAFGGYHPTYNWNDGRKKPSLLTYNLLDKGEDFDPYFYQAPNRFQFDDKVLTQFHINRSLIPEDANIINVEKKLSFSEIYDDYHSEIIIMSISFSVILLITIFLVLSDINLRRTKNKLQESEHALQAEKKELEEYQEELLEAKARLEESDQTKTHFIQNISHDIRGPLNDILLFSQSLLEANQELNKNAKSAITKDIENNVQAITSMLTDILFLSKLDAETIPLELEEVHINEVCTNVISELAGHEHAGVQTSFHTSVDDELTIPTELKSVHECLKQLISNAQKFTMKGNIIISCSYDKEKQQIVISVTDDGPGIPVQEAESIFTRFKKLDKQTPGSGLGLPICRALAKRIHAQVALDCNYTHGTRFIFSLPLQQ